VAASIAVFADWDGLAHPLRLGILHARSAGARELFDFEFDAPALLHPALHNLRLDPRLGLFQGRQYPAQGRETFGVFADASPDRWGRLLMRRRLERDKRAGRIAKSARLEESDYLLGVHDTFRVGALRFQLCHVDDVADTTAFLDDRHALAAPPFVKLRELEMASLALERDVANTAREGDAWLQMLLAPGGSLGGARPKASVIDPDAQLWIAKFPSVHDDYDVGAWELVIHTLARACGLRVPNGLARRFASPHHSFLVQRFDRTATGRRLHFASAMTLTDHKDGDDAASGASYLELARVLIDHGAQTVIDLRELWSRIVFNLLVSNGDDHLRNHGFILVPGKGWKLSEAYDMNPMPGAPGLRLNISEADNALDLELARSVATYFRVTPKSAREIVQRSQTIVKQWPKIATRLGIAASEQARMAPAFRLAD
jgi:serine/threonine-protein kinase HipA